jgi:hypothetical protein
MKLEMYWKIVEKSSNIKFHDNPCSGSRVVPCRRTDMTRLIVAFRNFVIAPKKNCIFFEDVMTQNLQSVRHEYGMWGRGGEGSIQRHVHSFKKIRQLASKLLEGGEA